MTQFIEYCTANVTNEISSSTATPAQLYVPGSVVLATNQINDTPIYVDLFVLIGACIVSRLAAYVILLYWRRPTA